MFLSLNLRILGPIALLILVGAGAASWIKREAVSTQAELAAEQQFAYAILEVVSAVEATHEEYRRYILSVMSFDVFQSPVDIADRYAQLSTAFQKDIEILNFFAEDPETRTALSVVLDSAQEWDAAVRVALGIEVQDEVPTIERFTAIGRRIEAALESMYATAQAQADRRAAQAQADYTKRVTAIFAAMLAVFILLGMFLLWFGRGLAHSLRGLAVSMEKIRSGDFGSNVEGEKRHDEIGQIARGVKAFGNTLAELTETKAEVEHLAMHDQLTGLPNRRALYLHIAHALTGGAKGSRRKALLHVDLDRFKQANDLMGHAAGDVILKRAATAMRDEVRAGDICARVGGDEFVIYLHSVGSDAEVGALANRVIEAVSEPMEIENELVTVGASIGIAFAEDAQFDSARLISNADIALYIAKGNGRGRAAFFTEIARQQFEDDMNIVRDLRRGLDTGQVIAFYQPQIDGVTGEIVGFEALARWRHPLKGLLPPSAFVDLAFENGLGDRLSDVIIDNAISALVSWREAGVTVPSVAINFSAKQLRDGGLTEDLDDALLFAGLEPDDIVVEVLESVLLGDDADPALETIARLKDRGYRIELDDFGTGHASISNLTRFKVDGVKIDRVFVSEFEKDPSRAMIVRTLIDLCRNLGITCLAEGVENLSEIDSLVALGCTKFQGYAISPPMPRQDVPFWVECHQNERRQATSG